MAVKLPKDLRAVDPDDLEAELAALGEPRFRTAQIQQWLWEKGAREFDAMTNLPKALRQKLADTYALNKITVAHEQRSADGSVKYGFALADGELVEGVLIPQGNRVTACVSSQVGCSLACKFCATGYLPLKRNLHAYEIYDQVFLLNAQSLAQHGRPLSNVVYMGMGEPLLNYRNVWTSIQLLAAPEALNFSPRRVTVSTAGIAKLIRKLGDDGFKAELALSLHAGNDEKRSRLMPINETNTLAALADALRHFYAKTNTRVTLEYVMLAGENDSLEDAAELAAFARTVPTKINLIEYNPIAEVPFQMTSEKRLRAFTELLESKGLIVNLRRSRGKDVDGGCGQLALRSQQAALTPH